jgi:hypothetical protein
MARREAMKNRLVILWAIAIAIMLLAMPAASAQQGRPQHHYQTGDLWVGCVANAPTMAWEDALAEALSVGNKENRSCWINQQRGWWFLRWTKRISVITVRKTALQKGSAVSSIPFFLFISHDRLYNKKAF